MSGGGWLRVVLFEIDGVRFALPAAQVGGLRAAAEGDEPVRPFEDVIGLKRGDHPSRQVLSLLGRAGRFAVSLPGEARIGELPATAIHPLPALVAACCRIHGLAALALDEQGPLVVLEPARLPVA